MERLCKHALPIIESVCLLRGPCKVIIKKTSVEKNWLEFRDASLPGYEFGNWQLQNNGKKGIRLWKEEFMCDFKLQWDCYEIRCQDTASEDWEP
jgi:hypothetical protein